MENRTVKVNRKGPKPETIEHYRTALELYKSTDLPITEICRQTGVVATAFKAYISRWHRDLLFKRNGEPVSDSLDVSRRLHNNKGQHSASHKKYREAVNACDDSEYINLTVSEIAQIFSLAPGSLLNQLRIHYPEILERRERERSRLGISDNRHRGAKLETIEQYKDAIDHLANSNNTIRETADIFNLSYSGLREFLLRYHKDLVEAREGKRHDAIKRKVRGELKGNGATHNPKEEVLEKYKKALELFQTTTLTKREICKLTSVPEAGFSNHLKIWHPDVLPPQRMIAVNDAATGEKATKRYSAATASKYSEAIKVMKVTGFSTAQVARNFNLNPDVFREYLKEHEPQLVAAQGMTTLANGRKVKTSSAKKYEEALRIHASTKESLNSIARRLNINPKSLWSFKRRNFPD